MNAEKLCDKTYAGIGAPPVTTPSFPPIPALFYFDERRHVTTNQYYDWYVSRGAELIPILTDVNHAPRGWRTNTYSTEALDVHLAGGGGLGWRLGPNHLVIDVDLYKPGSRNGYNRLVDHFGGPPSKWAPTVHTKRGGRHYYFTVPGDHVLASSLPDIYGAHVEFKTVGSHVTIPPTLGYKFDYASPLASGIPDAPAWLVHAITVTAPADTPSCPRWSDDVLRTALSCLDVSDFADHELWYPILCASHYATGGAGAEAFLEWSLGDPQYAYDGPLIRNRWDSLSTGSRPNYITHLSLLKTIRATHGGLIPPELQFQLDVKDFDLLEREIDNEAPVSSDPPQNLPPITPSTIQTPQPGQPAGASVPSYPTVQTTTTQEQPQIGITGYTPQTQAPDTGYYLRTLEDSIRQLDVGSPSSEIKRCAELIAGLDSLQRDRLVALLCKRTKLGKPVVRRLVAQSIKTRYAASEGLGARTVEQKNTENQASVPEDIGYYLAELILKEYFESGKNILYAAENRFWVYDKTHWIPKTDAQIDSFILRGSRRLRAEMSVAEQYTVSNLMTQGRLILRAICAEKPDILCRLEPRSVINCTNGELWIDEQTGHTELRPHSQDSGLQSCLSIPYDPAAPCPLWDDALYDMFAPLSNPWAVRDHMNEIIGYTLQPRKNLAAWVLLYGLGWNGKSLILDVLTKLLNNAVMSIELNEFITDKHIYDDVSRARAVIEDDLQKNVKLPESVLKKLSETKLISANPKGKARYDFINTATVWISSNHWPRINDMTIGMRRRPYVFVFKRNFKAEGIRDPDLTKKIVDSELTGVLNRTLQGLARLRQRGDLVRPEDCRRARDTWMDSANQVKRFVDSKLVQAENVKVPMSTVYQNYVVWCEAEGIVHKMQKTRAGVEYEMKALGLQIESEAAHRAVYLLGHDVRKEWT